MTDITLILGVSEDYLHIVFAKNEQIYCSQDWRVNANGTELLVPILTETCKKLKLLPQQLSRIACISGPGSFTGLRLVLTTAAAIRRAFSIPIATLNYLQVLALGAWQALQPTSNTLYSCLRVINNARKDLLYKQDFALTNMLSSPIPLTEPQVISIEEACATTEPTYFIGSGVKQYYTFLYEQSLTNPNIYLSRQKMTVFPHALLQLVLQLPDIEWKYKDPEPLYLRQCEAVENLSSIAIKQGKSPECSHAELGYLLTQQPIC